MCLVALHALLQAVFRVRGLVLGSFEHALGFPVASVVAAQLREAGGLGLREVEAIDRLGEAEVGVDARDHDARVDRDQLDPDHGDPDVGVDHEPLVEDQVDDIREPARAGRALEVVARGSLGGDSHLTQLLPGLAASNRSRRGRQRLAALFAPLRPVLAVRVALLVVLGVVVTAVVAATLSLLLVAALVVLLVALVLLHLGGRRLVLEPLDVAELDVRLEAGEVGLDSALHEAHARGHLLEDPRGDEVERDEDPCEVRVQLVEADHAGVLGPADRLPRDAVVLAPLGDLPVPLARAEPDFLTPVDLVLVVLVDLEDAVHELRELLELCPRLVGLVDRNGDIGPALDREPARLAALLPATATATDQLRGDLPGRAAGLADALLQALEALLADLFSLFPSPPLRS